MPEMPFFIEERDLPQVIAQVNELIRILYEERIGGYDRGELSADKMLSLDGSKDVISTEVAGYAEGILGTINQVTITDNGDGTITLSLPQDIDVDADVIFATLTLDNEGLHLLDTNASHDLIIKPGSDLTDDRILTFTTGDAARTITLTGNPTLDDWFDQEVKTTSSPTFVDVTLTQNANWILQQQVFS